MAYGLPLVSKQHNKDAAFHPRSGFWTLHRSLRDTYALFPISLYYYFAIQSVRNRVIIWKPCCDYSWSNEDLSLILHCCVHLPLFTFVFISFKCETFSSNKTLHFLSGKITLYWFECNSVIQYFFNYQLITMLRCLSWKSGLKHNLKRQEYHFKHHMAKGKRHPVLIQYS